MPGLNRPDEGRVWRGLLIAVPVSAAALAALIFLLIWSL